MCWVFIAILLGAYLYKKFDAKQNAIMIVIVDSISIVSMLLTVFEIVRLSKGIKRQESIK